jgi:hypothetical protein
VLIPDVLATTFKLDGLAPKSTLDVAASFVVHVIVAVETFDDEAETFAMTGAASSTPYVAE